MNTIRNKLTALAIALPLLLAVGCGGAPGPIVLPGQDAVDAQATINAWDVRQRATSDVAAQQTAAAARVTAEHDAEMRATQFAADAAMATATTAAESTQSALAVRATEAAYVATATWDALMVAQQQIAMQATVTADAAALQFQQQQADKALAARQAEIDRATLWNRMLPWIVALASLTAAGIILAIAGTMAVERLRRTRPQQAGDVWVMVGPGGPVALNRPPQLAAALPRAPISVSSPPALAAETPIAMPVPRRGCWLVAGMRGSGKTTAIHAVLRARTGTRIILDPRDWEGKWPADARVIGRGGDYDAIEGFLAEEMEAILAERGRQLGDGVPSRTLQADPIFVIIDELPAIVERLGDGCMTSPRRWMYEMRQMGGDLLLSTQSLRVQAMGLKGYGDIRQMFDFTLALGDVAKEQFPRLAEGMARPAVLSTLASARPVVVPHVEQSLSRGFSAGDLDGDGDDDVILLPDGPLFMAPTPQTPKADPRNMRPGDVERIRSLKACHWSQRAIEMEMFGYTGGAAWEAVREALDGDGRSWRAAAAWPAPGQVLR